MKQSVFRASCLLSLLLAVGGNAWAQTEGARVEGGVTAAPVASTGTEPIVVSGQVPDEATRGSILAALRQVYGQARVVDRMEIVPSIAMPANWAANIEKLITPSLKQVRRGQVQVDGSQIVLTGEVVSESQRQKMVSDMAGALNPTYTIRNQLRVPTATSQSDQSLLDQTLANRIIEFETASATLTAKGRALLDEMAPVITRLGNQSISIIGHTDNQGKHASNLALSRSRAEAVKGYLVSKGLDPRHLSTSGVGPDQPIASNETTDGRARNRRIEFKISGG